MNTAKHLEANRTTLNGASWLPAEKTLGFGRGIVGLCATQIAEAIRKASAARP